MQTEIKKHQLAYIILVLGLGLSIWIWMISGHNMIVRRMILAALIIWYPLWGYLVHRQAGQKSKALLLEYIAVALVSCGLVFLLTLI